MHSIEPRICKTIISYSYWQFISLSLLLILIFLPFQAVATEDTGLTKLPAIGNWNTNLNQLNILECVHQGSTQAVVDLKLYRSSGIIVDSRRLTINANGAIHVILNDFRDANGNGIENAYGLYRILPVTVNDTSNFLCFTNIYRFSTNSSALEYVYTLPIREPLESSVMGIYNSYDPSIGELVTWNFLSIFNPKNDAAIRIKLKVYSLNGSLIRDQNYDLQASQQIDIALGHDFGQTAGLYQIIPENGSRYGTFLARYNQSQTGSFNFGYSLAPVSPSCNHAIPLSTTEKARNWLELANTAEVAQAVTIKILDQLGSQLHQRQEIVSAKAQSHILINPILDPFDSGRTGTAIISCDTEYGILAQSNVYGRNSYSENQVIWAYSSQGSRIRPANAGNIILTSFNTSLNAANWLKLNQAGTGAVQINSMLYNELGNNFANSATQLSSFGSIDLPLHELSIPNSIIYGPAQVNINGSQVILGSELIRVFYNNNGQVQVVMPIPTAVIASDENYYSPPPGGNNNSGLIPNQQTCNVSSTHFDQGLCEIYQLQNKISNLSINIVTEEANINLGLDKSIKLSDFINKNWDLDPPQLNGPFPAYTANNGDPHTQVGEAFGLYAPYVVQGVRPFRFKYFRNEMRYRGSFTTPLSMYASLHGYGVIEAHGDRLGRQTQYPTGTEFTATADFRWHQTSSGPGYMSELGLEQEYYHELTTIPYDIIEDGIYNYPGLTRYRAKDQRIDSLMIDLEHPISRTVSALREKNFFPNNLPVQVQDEFIERYYQGAKLTYLSHLNLARNAGYANISIYGWDLFPRTWFGLNNPFDAWNYEPWYNYSSTIYQAIDILNPSIYVFYWDQRNVAYQLENIDRNRMLRNVGIAQGKGNRKIIPYLWHEFHGGGAGVRWWRNLPIPTIDIRAQTIASYFSGIDGIASWGWSSTNDETSVSLVHGRKYVLKNNLNTINNITIKKHYVLHLDDFDLGSNIAIIRLVDRNSNDNGGIDNSPSMTVNLEILKASILTKAESFKGYIEALAMVYPIEHILRHGQMFIDISALNQFNQKHPIIRRVRYGSYDLIFTYDSQAIYTDSNSARTINIDKSTINGQAGTISFQADSEPRFYLIKHS